MFPTISPSSPSSDPTSPLTATNYNEWLKENAKDDGHYLERNEDPPRFELYNIARKLIIENIDKDKRRVPGILKEEDMDSYLPVYDPMTMDEFDYKLKKALKHTTPEQRYQERKEPYYFHDLYRDNGEYGCNPTARPEICVPECRYHGKTGRFEDEELVAEHKKHVEFFEKHNAIIEIKIQDDNTFRITQVRKYSTQQQLPNGNPS